MIYIVVFVACLAIFYLLFTKLKAAGWVTPAKITVTESPTYISTASTIFYKYHIGSYCNICSIVSESVGLCDGLCRGFGIFYSNPQDVPAHLLQSVAGVILGESNEKYEKALLDAGYEKMNLPKVSRSVEARQPFTGMLSIMALVYRTYPAIRDFVNRNKLETSIAMEVYENTEIIVHFPLDHQQEFFVPQYLPTDELESKLARRKFDSSEGESESEPEKDYGDSQEDEGQDNMEVENVGSKKDD